VPRAREDRSPGTISNSPFVHGSGPPHTAAGNFSLFVCAATSLLRRVAYNNNMIITYKCYIRPGKRSLLFKRHRHRRRHIGNEYILLLCGTRYIYIYIHLYNIKYICTYIIDITHRGNRLWLYFYFYFFFINFAFLPIQPRLVSRHAREFSTARHSVTAAAVAVTHRVNRVPRRPRPSSPPPSPPPPNVRRPAISYYAVRACVRERFPVQILYLS